MFTEGIVLTNLLPMVMKPNTHDRESNPNQHSGADTVVSTGCAKCCSGWAVIVALVSEKLDRIGSFESPWVVKNRLLFFEHL